MNAETEAYVAMAGPVAGTAASLLCHFVARSEGSDLLLAPPIPASSSTCST